MFLCIVLLYFSQAVLTAVYYERGSGPIRDIQYLGISNNRMIIAYRGSGRIYINEHGSLKEYLDTNWMQQDKKYGDKGCYYAEFPLIPFPAKIKIVGNTRAYEGNNRLDKPAVEAWTYVEIGSGGQIISQNVNANTGFHWTHLDGNEL